MLTELHTNPTQLTGLLAFAIATAACARAALRRRDRSNGVWRVLALTQALFFLEVLLGLRHQVHGLVDTVFAARGWYAGRSALQIPLVSAALLVALVAIAALLRWRGLGHSARAAMAASVIVLGSFVVEAISLHRIDSLMYATIGPVKRIAFLWAACAAVVALMALRSAPRRGGTPPAFRR